MYFYMNISINKKFASLKRHVIETFHVANDFVRCLSHCVGEAFQNVFYAKNQYINIAYLLTYTQFLK